MAGVYSRRQQLLLTVGLAAGTLANGLHAGSIAPALEPLARRLGSTVSSVSLVVSMDAIGYAIGCLLCQSAARERSIRYSG